MSNKVDKETFWHFVKDVGQFFAKKIEIPKKLSDLEIDIEVGGGASSWNDLTDKPFGKEGEENYLVSPMDLQFVYGGAYPDEPITVDPADFSAGNILYVVWNGTVHETTVQYHNIAMCNYIGGTANDGTSIPFSIMDIDGNGTLTISDHTNNPTGTISFALAKSLAVIKTLDPEYLPIDKEISEDGNGLLKNSTVAKAKKELEERIASVEEKTHEPLGSIETIDERLYTNLREQTTKFVSEKQYTVDDIIGSIAFGNPQEGNATYHTITAENITEYEWGFTFGFGKVVNDSSYDEPGLYMASYFDYLTDKFVERFATYGLHLVKKIDEKLIPFPKNPMDDITAEVGQTIVVKAVDKNGKPTEWETVPSAARFFEKVKEATNELWSHGAAGGTFAGSSDSMSIINMSYGVDFSEYYEIIFNISLTGISVYNEILYKYEDQNSNIPVNTTCAPHIYLNIGGHKITLFNESVHVNIVSGIVAADTYDVSAVVAIKWSTGMIYAEGEGTIQNNTTGEETPISIFQVVDNPNTHDNIHIWGEADSGVSATVTAYAR